MHLFYANVAKGDRTVSPDERRAIRDAMIDYGALQAFPVGEQSFTEHDSVVRLTYLIPDWR